MEKDKSLEDQLKDSPKASSNEQSWQRAAPFTKISYAERCSGASCTVNTCCRCTTCDLPVCVACQGMHGHVEEET